MAVDGGSAFRLPAAGRGWCERRRRRTRCLGPLGGWSWNLLRSRTGVGVAACSAIRADPAGLSAQSAGPSSGAGRTAGLAGQIPLQRGTAAWYSVAAAHRRDVAARLRRDLKRSAPRASWTSGGWSSVTPSPCAAAAAARGPPRAWAEEQVGSNARSRGANYRRQLRAHAAACPGESCRAGARMRRWSLTGCRGSPCRW